MPVPEFTESAQACLFSANREKCSVIDKEFLIKNYSDIYNKLQKISRRNPQVQFVDPFQRSMRSKEMQYEWIIVR